MLVSLPLTASLSTLRGARLGSKVSWSGNMLMGDWRRPWAALVIQTHLRVKQGILSVRKEYGDALLHIVQAGLMSPQ